MGRPAKIALSVGSFLVAVLVAAAFVEVVYGDPRPRIVQFYLLLIEAPILFLIWRPRRRP